MAAASSLSEFVPARIVRVSQETANVVGMRLQAPRDYEWTPGQHLALCAAPGEGALGYYSIASAPRHSEPGILEIAALLGSLPKGVSPKEGKEVWISQPSGEFMIARRRSPERLVLIGMGTGVAPLRAMVQELVQRRSLTGVLLLQGARSESDLLFRQEFSSCSERGMEYRPVLSQPTGVWPGRVGRVQQHLDDLDLRADFRLCGSPAMVSEVTRSLVERGVPPDQIQGEGY